MSRPANGSAVRLDQIAPGNQLRADGGFTCIAHGAVVTVCRDERGDLYIPCSAGQHALDGQVGPGGRLVGLTFVSGDGR